MKFRIPFQYHRWEQRTCLKWLKQDSIFLGTGILLYGIGILISNEFHYAANPNYRMGHLELALTIFPIVIGIVGLGANYCSLMKQLVGVKYCYFRIVLSVLFFPCRLIDEGVNGPGAPIGEMFLGALMVFGLTIAVFFYNSWIASISNEFVSS